MMRLHTLIVPAGALLALSVVAPASAQEATQFRYETQRVDDYAARRAASVASTMGFSAWPRTPELYAAPAVSRTLLREPDAVAGEVRACTTVRFNDHFPPPSAVTRHDHPPPRHDVAVVRHRPGQHASQVHLGEAPVFHALQQVRDQFELLQGS